MKFIYFTRQDNNFKDILTDISIKKFIKTKITWTNFILLGFSHNMPEEVHSYITIKYGDDIVDKNHIVKDRTPIPNVDYKPLRPGPQLTVVERNGI